MIFEVGSLGCLFRTPAANIGILATCLPSILALAGGRVLQYFYFSMQLRQA